MGMFDYVKVTRDEFVCSEGHDMRDESFQSKDFDCSMSTASIGERLEWEPHPTIGRPFDRPFLGRVDVYATCPLCPAFVIRGRMKNEDREFVGYVHVLHEFSVEIVDDVVRSVTCTSGTLADEVANAVSFHDNAITEGPMTREEARRIHHEWHASYWEARRAREAAAEAAKVATNG